MLFQRWKFWVSGVSTCVIGSLGFVGNILSLLILSRRWKVQIIISQQLYDFFSGPCTISLTTCWPVYVWLTFCLSSSTCSLSRLRLDWTMLLQSSYSPLRNAGIYLFKGRKTFKISHFRIILSF